MKNSIGLLVGIIVAAVVTTLFIAFGVYVMLTGVDEAGDGETTSLEEPTLSSASVAAQPTSTSASSTAKTTKTTTSSARTQAAGVRPECPAQTIGGVDLPCLGADSASATAPAKDDITVVTLWAWWCEPCRKELPELAKFAEDHPEYTVVGVHTDAEEKAGLDLLEELGVDLPSYQDDKAQFIAEQNLPSVVPILMVFRGDERVGMYPQMFTSAEDIAEAVEDAL